MNTNTMNKALQTLIDNMPEKTGKSLEEWKVLLKKKTFAKHSEAVNFLKRITELPMVMPTPSFFYLKMKNAPIKIFNQSIPRKRVFISPIRSAVRTLAFFGK